MKEKFDMKSVAFNKANITHLADSIIDVYLEFEYDKFLNTIFLQLDSLELKKRSNLIEDALVSFLPKPFQRGVDVLLKILPDEIIDTENFGYDGFILMPQAGYVTRCGMENFELSMNAFYEITRRFTAEFHIRFFILEHYEKTMQILEKWCMDDCPHVRRLVSEGCRPRLPWAFALNRFKKDPTPILKLLEKLKNDPELYVRRSVANNLNDISKDNPDVVIKTLISWQDDTKEMRWLTKHALRTLLKDGNVDALSLLGYKQSDKFDVTITLNATKIYLGENLDFNVEISSKEVKPLKIMIDFIIYYKKANGSLSPKVFKLSSKTIKANETINISKKHKLANFSTRKHYKGEHNIALVINGKIYDKHSFELKV